MSNTDFRAAVLRQLGPFPARVPLDLAVGAPIDAGDHTRQLLSYAVEPGERVGAWLLLPNGDAPAGGWPAILAIHQHGGEYHLGKSEPAGMGPNPMYFYGRDLCQRGFAVLCPDQLCFEERRPPEDEPLDRAVGMAYERFEFTRRVVAGSCLQTKYLHDFSCALDVLGALPEVNAAQIGCFGHSLGGQESLWLAWYDQRIRAAASSCGFGMISTLIRDRINHNFALYVPGMLEYGDIDALVADLAPRPFLFTAGDADPIFPIDGVRHIAARATEAYAAAGAPERFAAHIFSGVHSLPDDAKEAAYGFLERWVKG